MNLGRWIGSLALVAVSPAVARTLDIPPAADAPCRIVVVERGTDHPVPLVELRTTHNVRLVTDNAGVIAFDLPELFGETTWFQVIGQGYEVPADGFGMRGVRLKPEPGGELRVEVDRTIIAKRMGRITGGGLFAQSQQLGEELDWPESRIVGADSVQNVVHDGRLYWFWGDTTLARYPLGIFDGTGATTAINPLESSEPPLRLHLEYFTGEDGRPWAIADMPGDGPTWITGLASLPDAEGTHHLVASYSKIKPPMDLDRKGLATWDEETERFVPFLELWKRAEGETPTDSPPMPTGHPTRWVDEEGQSWVLFGDPFPTMRVRESFEAWSDPDEWEALEPQPELPRAGGGKPVVPHSGSIAWNEHRGRWVTVFMEKFGEPSAFGELWYAEADSPTGPWGPAVKVLSHDDYTFYNPRIHPEWTAEGSDALYFEGTYTTTFSGNKRPTPRYNYNQILYRLDLDDPTLAPARGE